METRRPVNLRCHPEIIFRLNFRWTRGFFALSARSRVRSFVLARVKDESPFARENVSDPLIFQQIAPQLYARVKVNVSRPLSRVERVVARTSPCESDRSIISPSLASSSSSSCSTDSYESFASAVTIRGQTRRITRRPRYISRVGNERGSYESSCLLLET